MLAVSKVNENANPLNKTVVPLLAVGLAELWPPLESIRWFLHGYVANINYSAAALPPAVGPNHRLNKSSLCELKLHHMLLTWTDKSCFMSLCYLKDENIILK